MVRFFFLFISVFAFLSLGAAPEDYVWNTPSRNSSESMPCGGGSIGLNVWVEKGDLYFYVSRSGCFDANNTLLKTGRFRLHFDKPLGLSDNFSQILHLCDGNVVVRDGSRVINIWVDVFKPVIHVDLNSKQKNEVEYSYESWRYRDRLIGKRESFQTSYKFGVPPGDVTAKDHFEVKNNCITFWHQNPDSTVFDATVDQQNLSAYKHQMYNPLSYLIFGGRMTGENLRYQGTYKGVYCNTDFQGWKYLSDVSRHHHLDIVLANNQGSLKQWNVVLEKTIGNIHSGEDWKETRLWWHQWWQRSFIEAGGKFSSVSRNYTLFRYMLGCNALSDWPTKFNGGLFCFDPVLVDTSYTFTPDYRRWGGGTYTAQNQRLLYWPLIKSGDYDALRSQLDFYLRIFPNAKLRSHVYWKHDGAAFTEQLENFGLPEYDEYGKKRPAGFDPGLQYNAWLEYTWDTVLEFCQMAFDASDAGGMNISKYIPWIESSLDFFDEHYSYLARLRGCKLLDSEGHIAIYPGSGAETFKMAYNPSSTCAGLRRVTSSLIAYLEKESADTTVILKYKKLLSQWPDISYREINGHKVIAPAVVWSRVNNTEPTMLYPVFPWHQFGVGKDSLDIAVNTWKYDPYVLKFKGIVGWEQANIWAADLGLTDDAVYWNLLKWKDGPYRFPAFFGPGHDWSPDCNWGGSGMIGLQDMLLQEANGKIYLFPAWPKNIDVHFKLHCSGRTTVEATLKEGKIIINQIIPSSRLSDIIIR